jgi:2-oxoisovalerate dehydrogenase E1 component
VKTRTHPAAGEEVRAALLRDLLRIRYLEQALLDLFSRGALFGTTHTSIGQEAVAVSVLRALDLRRDVVFSSHRCHGHFLAYGGDPRALLAEIMGRDSGVCGGIGGSQHLQYRNFYSNGIQGGIVPVAVGAALAERRKPEGGIAVVFLGDGTLGEGATYEALNMASLWSSPTLFVLEDNGYAQTTPRALGVAGKILARAEAFGIEAAAVETNDVEQLLPLMQRRVADVRAAGRPFFQVVGTYRLAPHSKGDDHRDPAEIQSWRLKDPITLLADRLDAPARESAERAAREEIDLAIEAASRAEWPSPARVAELAPLRGERIAGSCAKEPCAAPDPRTGLVTVGRDLNAALHTLMAGDDRVILLGEDLLDPYGGAFKIAQGLSTRFPDRVLTTPISEAGLVGIANGMALRGLRPVAEIMFGDFTLLAADQIVNHAAKFEGMYNRQASCPVTIRTPMGGRRGYGPTHSQSLESFFTGVPGLEVVAVSPLHPAGMLLRNAVLASPRPTLFVENKLMYARPVRLPDPAGYVGPFASAIGDGLYPTVRLSSDPATPPDVVLIAYGGSVELAMEAAESLLVDHEIACDILAPSQIAPLPMEDLAPPCLQAGRVVIIEEGCTAWGWGAELAASLHEAPGAGLRAGSVRRLGAAPHPIPVSRPLEEAVLPQTADIVRTVLAMMGGRG